MEEVNIQHRIAHNKNANEIFRTGFDRAQLIADEPFIKTNINEQPIKSTLGTEVEGYVILSAEPYTDYRGDEVQPPRSIILRTALCRARLSKNIVRTEIQGRPGTIKEYVSSGDYDIIIKATITTAENVDLEYQSRPKVPVYERENTMPFEGIALISNWVEAETVIAIENDYLNSLGINDIIIEGADFPQRRGTLNTFDFDIFAVSERYQDIVIIEPGSNGVGV